MHWTCKINIQQLTKENKISAMNAEVFGPLLVNSLFLYIRWNREDEKSAMKPRSIGPLFVNKKPVNTSLLVITILYQKYTNHDIRKIKRWYEAMGNEMGQLTDLVRVYFMELPSDEKLK